MLGEEGGREELSFVIYLPHKTQVTDYVQHTNTNNTMTHIMTPKYSHLYLPHPFTPPSPPPISEPLISCRKFGYYLPFPSVCPPPASPNYKPLLVPPQAVH